MKVALHLRNQSIHTIRQIHRKSQKHHKKPFSITSEHQYHHATEMKEKIKSFGKKRDVFLIPQIRNHFDFNHEQSYAQFSCTAHKIDHQSNIKYFREQFD